MKLDTRELQRDMNFLAKFSKKRSLIKDKDTVVETVNDFLLEHAAAIAFSLKNFDDIGENPRITLYLQAVRQLIDDSPGLIEPGYFPTMFKPHKDLRMTLRPLMKAFDGFDAAVNAVNFIEDFGEGNLDWDFAKEIIGFDDEERESRGLPVDWDDDDRGWDFAVNDQAADWWNKERESLSPGMRKFRMAWLNWVETFNEEVDAIVNDPDND